MNGIGGPTLPAELLREVARDEGGAIVLVIGAGCSSEAPTSLPLASALAIDAHQRLIDDGVLRPGECPDPSDLSAVAQTVYNSTGSQLALVDRLPCNRFRSASPNTGYQLAAAMLRERAIGLVVTLNFDLAISAALTSVGSGSDVSIVAVPEQHRGLGATNVIYLHGNVEVEPNRWILRVDAIDAATGTWMRGIVGRAFAGPITVFVGLGDPAGVFLRSTQEIAEPLQRSGLVYYQVGPGAYGSTPFSTALRVPETRYIPMGWSAFMTLLSNRLVREHVKRLEVAYARQVHDQGWSAEPIADLCRGLEQCGLLVFGTLRARWLLSEDVYMPWREPIAQWLADLVHALALIGRVSGTAVVFAHDGVVELYEAGRLKIAVILAHGQGYRGWLLVEQRLREAGEFWRHRNPYPRAILAAGIPGGRPVMIAPPVNISYDESPDSILTGQASLMMLTTDEIRTDPTLATQLVSQ